MERPEDHSQVGHSEQTSQGGSCAHCSITDHQGTEGTTSRQKEGETWYVYVICSLNLFSLCMFTVVSVLMHVHYNKYSL